MKSNDLPPALPEAPAPRPSSSSLLWRMLNIFAVPGAVFAEVKGARTSVANWLVPILILSLAGSLSFVVIFSQPAVVQQFREQQTTAVEEQVTSGKMTREGANEELALIDKLAKPWILKTGGSALSVLLSFVSVFWWALLLWTIGRVCLKAPVGFGKMLEVAGLASAISSLEVVVRTLLVMTSSNPAASMSLGMLATNTEPQNKLSVLLSVVNLMTFWALIVRSIGLARIAGTRFGRAASWVFVVWALTLMAMLGAGTALQSAFQR